MWRRTKKAQEGLNGIKEAFSGQNRSFLVRAAAVHRVDHVEEIGPGRDLRVAGLHDLKTHVVEGLHDGHCNEHTLTSDQKTHSLMLR